MHNSIRRERWPSRFSYLVASASSIIGIGNLTRFPSICSKYDGITFFIPYIVMTWIVGYGILVLEVACGEFNRSGMISFFHVVYRQFRGFGVLQMVSTLIALSYINVILGWLLIYMIRSQYSPWHLNPNYYFQTYVLNSNEFNINVFIVTLLCTALIWTTLFMSIYKGVTHTTKIVYMTLPFSIIMLSLLFIRAITLPNSIKFLINMLKIDYNALLSTEIYMDAVGQVLFSLCIGIGASSAYGSYRIKDGFLVKDAFYIVILNFLVEIIGWIIIVCIGGWSNKDISSNKFSLAFVLYPQLIHKLPFFEIWSFLYFLFMLTFGINCSHAALESIVTCLLDSNRYSNNSRIQITLKTTICGSILSLIFCFVPQLIDPFDYFTCNFMLCTLGETLTACYFYNKTLIATEIGRNTLNIAHYSTILGPIVASFLYFSTSSYGLSIILGLSIFFFGNLFAIFTNENSLEFKKAFYLIFFYQGDIFLSHFNDTLRLNEQFNFKLNQVWYFTLKYLSTSASINVYFLYLLF